MKRTAFWTLALIVIAMVVTTLHWGVVTLKTIPGAGAEPTLMTGDRVLLNRWAYGYRMPFTKRWGYKRLATAVCHRNDWAIYNTPASSPTQRIDTTVTCAGRCLGLPSDTIWMGAHGKVSQHRNYAAGQIWPLVVPSKGKFVKVTPWNASLYAKTINQHENGKASVKGDSLCINGRCVAHYRFTQDYYWMESGRDDNVNDSRMHGFIPHKALLGRMECIVFSLDNYRPRWDRTFLPL